MNVYSVTSLSDLTWKKDKKTYEEAHNITAFLVFSVMYQIKSVLLKCVAGIKLREIFRCWIMKYKYFRGL